MAHGGALPDSADEAAIDLKPDDPYFGENLALWVWDSEHRIGVHLYLKTLAHLGKVHLRRETVNVHLPDGTVLLSDADGPGPRDPRRPKGPNLEMEQIEPFERWRYRYDATAQATTAAEMQSGLLHYMPLEPLAFEIEATMAAEPAVSAGPYDDPGARYQQLLWATGTVRTKDGDLDLRGGGLRTHRKGHRDTRSLHGHTWFEGLFPDGRAFKVSRIRSTDGTIQAESASVEVGGERHAADIVEAPGFTGALPGEELPIVLDSPLGRIRIDGTLEATNFVTNMDQDPFRFCPGTDRSGPDHRIMSQGLASYRWDDQLGPGMTERSIRVHDMPPTP